jgi:hypothetical protein
MSQVVIINTGITLDDGTVSVSVYHPNQKRLIANDVKTLVNGKVVSRSRTIEELAAKCVPAPCWLWEVAEEHQSLIIPTEDDNFVTSLDANQEYVLKNGEFLLDSEGAKVPALNVRWHVYSYNIVDSSELPTRDKYRNAWSVDPALFTDGVGNSTNTYEIPDTTPEVEAALAQEAAEAAAENGEA